MKSLRAIAYTVVAAGMMAATPALATDPPAPPIDPPSVVTIKPEPVAADHLKDSIAAIDRAADPSAAVEAYARGIAIDPENVGLREAYVKRLVSLGLPELAETQARDLTGRRPELGLPWAVAAYMDARRDSTKAALEEIILAVGRAGDDPFVQRTAGQLLTYYDLNASRLEIDTPLKNSLEDLRKAMNGKTEFTRAYQKARDEYAAAPKSANETVPPTEPYSNAAPPDYTYTTYAAPYTDPYIYDYAAYPYWPSLWWWGPGAVIINQPFFFHHHFDNHHFDHGQFDHGHSDFNHSHWNGFHANHGLVNHSSGAQRSFVPQRSFTPRAPMHVNPTPRVAPSFRSNPGARSFHGSVEARPSFGGHSFGGRSAGSSIHSGGHVGGGGHSGHR